MPRAAEKRTRHELSKAAGTTPPVNRTFDSRAALSRRRSRRRAVALAERLFGGRFHRLGPDPRRTSALATHLSTIRDRRARMVCSVTSRRALTRRHDQRAAAHRTSPRTKPSSVSLKNASQGPRTALGWGPSAAADSTLEMRFSGLCERGRKREQRSGRHARAVSSGLRSEWRRPTTRAPAPRERGVPGERQEDCLYAGRAVQPP